MEDLDFISYDVPRRRGLRRFLPCPFAKAKAQEIYIVVSGEMMAM